MMWTSGIRHGVVALFLLWPAAANARQQATLLRNEALIELAADGTYSAETEIDLRVEDDATARRQSQYAIGFEATRETLVVLWAATLKPDGRRIAVAPAGILEQAAPNARALAGYADPRQRVIIFPEVVPGDRLQTRFRRIVRVPLMPGAYTGSIWPDLSLVLNAQDIVVRVPPGMVLHSAMEGYESSTTTDGDRQVHRFHTSLLDPPDEDIAAIGRLDRAPRLFTSTFASHDDFAAGLAGVLRPRMVATDAVRAKAMALVAGITEPRTRVERLYEWLGHNVRYVDNPLSTVSIGLHDADTILTNLYADSVDAAVLLVTMLATLDIPAVPVLVNRGNLYSVPGVPTLGPFNHMIVFVPELELYLDANNGTVPFGSLPFSELGKPALHLGGGSGSARGSARASDGGPAVRRTPVTGREAAISRTRSVFTLGSAGEITGTTRIDARGAFRHVLSEVALQIGREGTTAAARMRLQALGLDGSANISPPAVSAATLAPAHVQISLEPRPDYIEGTGIPMTPRIGLLARPGDGLAGPLGVRGLALDAPTPCFPGSQSEVVRLNFPIGMVLHRLPKDVVIEAPGLRYESRWSRVHKGVEVERTATTSYEQALCTGETREALAKALIGIRREQLQQVALDPE